MLNIDKRERQNEIMFNIRIRYHDDFYWPVNNEMKFISEYFTTHFGIEFDITGKRNPAYSSSANILKVL